MPRLPIHDPKKDENENVDICADCWTEHVRGDSEDETVEVDAASIETLAKAAGFNVAKNPACLELVKKALTVEDIDSGCEHPNYDDENYRCRICNSALTAKDN